MTVQLAAPTCIRMLAADFGLSPGQLSDVLRSLARLYGLQVDPPSRRWEWGCVRLPRTKRADITAVCEEYHHRVYALRRLPAWQRREMK